MGNSLTVYVSPDTTGTVSLNSTPLDSYPTYRSYASVTPVTLGATPLQGYEFSRWAGDVPVSETTTNPITLNVNCTINVTAVFVSAPQTQLTLDVGTPGTGTVTVDQVPAAGYPSSTPVLPGTTVILEAVPSPGYVFREWAGTVPSPYLNPMPLLVNGDDIAVTAIFDLDLAYPSGYTLYMPNITGDYQLSYEDWRDSLQVDNLGDNPATIQIILYGEDGAQVYSGLHTINASDRKLIDINALSPFGALGIVNFTDPKLLIRQFQDKVDVPNDEGGITEFLLADTLSSSLGFFFSNFKTSLKYKGLAIANFASTPITVTLTAKVTGAPEITATPFVIGPKQKIARVHNELIGDLTPSSELHWIKASASAPGLTGVAVSTSDEAHLVVFTQAVELSD